MRSRAAKMRAVRIAGGTRLGAAAAALVGLIGCREAAAPGLDAPSCATIGSGTSRCGANGDACCVSPMVPGGSYDRSYVNDGEGASGLADSATVSTFRLDRYLITVGRFRQFVAASVAGWTPPAGSGKHAHLNGRHGLANGSGAGYEAGWSAGDDIELASTSQDWTARLECEPSFHTWTDVAGPNEALPMNCIDWFEAYAFCIWDGGFLPSEAEWEFAAAGGGQQREYPWGTTAPGTSNLYAIYGCYYPSGTGTCTGLTNIAPVGTAMSGAGLWGQLDLLGNMFQWNLDWDATYVAPCADCAHLTPGFARYVRGGSFYSDVAYALLASHGGRSPESRGYDLGFRCARTP
jgi:formylglycine-generating enzyme required for sulfatase activity